MFIICYLKVTTTSFRFKALTYPNLTVFYHLAAAKIQTNKRLLKKGIRRSTVILSRILPKRRLSTQPPLIRVIKL